MAINVELGTMGVDWEERINFDRMRRDRLNRVKKALDESDLNAIIVFALEDIRYMTGFRTHLGPVLNLSLAAVVLPKRGDPLLWCLDKEHVKARMPWLNPNDVFGRPCIRTEGGTLRWAEEVKSRIGNLAEGKIGVDILTPSLIKWMQKGFPKAEFVDAKPIISKAKRVKTPDEIECQRAVTMITEAGFHALLEKMKPGVKECELLAAAWAKFTELGSEWSQCSNIVASGPYTAPYRRFTSDRIIREGDLVIVDIGAGFNGYWGDFTRTYVCGDILPTKEQIDLHQECYDTLFAACNEARVGNNNTDVSKWLNHPELNPNSFGMSSGHGAGVNPWEEPWVVNITEEDAVPFEVGHFMSIEPYAGKIGIGGIRLENQVLVTEDGPEIITTLPFDERLLRNVHPLDKTTGRKIRRG